MTYQITNDPAVLDVIRQDRIPLDLIRIKGDRKNFWQKLKDDYHFLGFPLDRLVIFDYNQVHRSPDRKSIFYGPEKLPIKNTNGFWALTFYDQGCMFISAAHVKKIRGLFYLDPDVFFTVIHEITHWLYAHTLPYLPGRQPAQNMTDFGFPENDREWWNLILGAPSEQIEFQVCDLSYYLMRELGLISGKISHTSLHEDALDESFGVLSSSTSPEVVYQRGKSVFQKSALINYLPKDLPLTQG